MSEGAAGAWICKLDLDRMLFWRMAYALQLAQRGSCLM